MATEKLSDEHSELNRKTHTHEYHNLVPFDNQSDTKKSLEFSKLALCDKHEGEEIEIFCNDCQLAICALCFLESHQSHKSSPVKEVANIFRTQIASNVLLLSDCVPEAQNKIEQLEKHNVKSLQIVRQIESDVNKKQLKLRALFDKIMQEDVRSLISTLSSSAHAKSKQSEIEKEDVDGHLTKLNSYIMFCKDIAAKGSDVEICRIANEVNSNAKELKDLHGTLLQRSCDEFLMFSEERKFENFLKAFHGNMLGKIEVPGQDNVSSPPQQKSSTRPLYNSRNHQVTAPRTSSSDLFKKIRGIMNKMPPSMFEKIYIQIAALPIDDENSLSGCTEILFEKAITDSKFVREYAILAQRLMTLSVPYTDNPEVKVTFRKLLLNRCQEEFEKDQQDERDIIRRQKEIEETTTEDHKTRLVEENEALISRSQRRSLGNIRFIGELFKLKMLTEKIIYECIKKLFDAEDEDSLELLCNLLKTIGKELDTDKGKKLMDSYFYKLGDKQGSVPSKIRFMIKDLLEQRKNKWFARRVKNIPETIVDIHSEAHRCHLPPKARQDRCLLGSSSTEKPGDDGLTMAVSSNTKDRIDMLKTMQITKNKEYPVVLSLKPRWQMGSSQETESMLSNRFLALENFGSGRIMNENFTPQRFSEFSSVDGRVSSQERSSSQELRRVNSPHGAVPRTSSPLTIHVQMKKTRKDQLPAKELSSDIIEHKAEALLEEYLHVQDLREAVTCVQELESPESLHIFVSFAIKFVLEKTELARILTGTLLHQLLTEGDLSFQQCELGFKEVFQEADSLAVDIPNVWEYLGEIVAGTIKDNYKMWQLLKTGCQELALNRRDVFFRKTLAVGAHKLGAERTSMALRRSGMRWSDFVSSGLFSYTKQNNLEQLDPVREELIALLKHYSDNQPIFEWIQRNVTPAEAETREFTRALVTAVCTRAIMASETSFDALSASCFVSEAKIVSRQTLLLRYFDHKPDREIQALYALQALVHSLEHPPNILHSLFNILYDKKIIAEHAFWEWQKSTDLAEQTGKGIAFQSVRPFFDWLDEGTEETTGS